MIVPAAGCDNFDWITGCRGHEDPEPGTLVMTNFVTGKNVPAKLVPNSDPNEPSAAWIQGWNDWMDGTAESPPIFYSKAEAADWLEGYEAAERD